MHFIIMGSGRVGASLAQHLDSLGHSVAIIDQDADAFRRLPSSFGGQKVKGVGFDQDTLKKAGIAEAYAFAAVSDGDNSNIIAARVARETFGVKRVVARIYDPQRAEMYLRLGIPTVCTVKWSTGAILRQMLPTGAEVIYRDEESDHCLLRIRPQTQWVGLPFKVLEERADVRVCYFTRFGKSQPLSEDAVIQEGDELTLAVPTSQVDYVSRLVTYPPQLED